MAWAIYFPMVVLEFSLMILQKLSPILKICTDLNADILNTWSVNIMTDKIPLVNIISMIILKNYRKK
jgi:hypothetical protein